MDVACGEYGEHTARLVSEVANGRLIYQESPASSTTCLTAVSSGAYIISSTTCSM